MINLHCVSRSGILMILSPAKTLDLSPTLPNAVSELKLTLPECCPEKTAEIARTMKKMSSSELTKALKLSANLSKTTLEYWKNFRLDGLDSSQNCFKPCIFAYAGAAFQGLQATECCTDAIKYMQDNLRILDAVYGVLRPLDQIQPYRLELNTKNVFSKNTNLASYWSDAVTKSLMVDLHTSTDKNPILLNLASEEYSAAVDAFQISESCRFVKAIFTEDGRVVAVHAKRARGLMVRFLAEHRVTTIAGIQKFAQEGYQFVASKSDDITLVFDRCKQPMPQMTKRTAEKVTSSKAAPTKRSKR